MLEVKRAVNTGKPAKIKIYTEVRQISNKIYVRGLDENGDDVIAIVDYQPNFWVPLAFNTYPINKYIVDHTFGKYRDMITGEPLAHYRFNNISNANRFLYTNKDNPEIRSGVNFVSQFINEFFGEEEGIGSDKLKIYSYDIETEVGHRDVPNDTMVYVRHDPTHKNLYSTRIGDAKQIAISMFEQLEKFDVEWEVFNEENNVWVRYHDHPYRFKGGFPNPEKAEERVTLITVKDVINKKIHTFGIEKFDNKRDDVIYHHCENEWKLLQSFVDWWASDYPHIMHGWNTACFDNTYIANRVKLVLGEEQANRLSPFGVIDKRVINNNEFGNRVVETSWLGIANLDYLKLYKKFTYGNRESYKLDSIAEYEVGIKKIENPTKGTFKDFYSGEFDVNEYDQNDNEIRKLGYQRTKLKKQILSGDDTVENQYNELNKKIIAMCKQLFIEYNIRDVELVDKIDAKQKFVDLIMTIAYSAKCNYDDVFSPTRTWDNIIYNYVLKDDKIIPVNKPGKKTEKFPGAYVKAPLIGKHEFCESYDLDSLYPHLIMEYNISPDTIIRDSVGNPVSMRLDLQKLINKTQDTSFAHENNYSMASSGRCFTKDYQGVLPALCEMFYSNRKAHKKTYLGYKSEHEKIIDEMRKRGLIDG